MAINIIREGSHLGDRNYVNRGKLFIKFFKKRDMNAWADEFEGKIIGQSDRPLTIKTAKEDLVCYHPKFFGVTYMRPYNRVWDIVPKNIEAVITEV